MPGSRLRLAALLLVARAVSAQSVEIYSEFQRPHPLGGIQRADASLKPREILSPGIPRGGFASFHIAVTAPAKTIYVLYAVAIPENVVRLRVYRERFSRETLIPDELEEARMPNFGVMPDPDDRIAGQVTRGYLLDVWAPPDADVRRIRIEVLLKVGDWRVAPMELRILPARVPPLPPGLGGELPDPRLPADSAAWAAAPLRYPDEPRTIREAIRRNAAQDAALAGPPDWQALRYAVMQQGYLRPAGAETYLAYRTWLQR